MALTLRGKSAKYFKIKLGDIIFKESMFDYVDVMLRFKCIVLSFFVGIFKLLTFSSVIYFF